MGETPEPEAVTKLLRDAGWFLGSQLLPWQQEVLAPLLRRCERCRKVKPTAEFPAPHKPDGPPRPFCLPCTDYIHWATA